MGAPISRELFRLSFGVRKPAQIVTMMIVTSTAERPRSKRMNLIACTSSGAESSGFSSLSRVIVSPTTPHPSRCFAPSSRGRPNLLCERQRMAMPELMDARTAYTTPRMRRMRIMEHLEALTVFCKRIASRILNITGSKFCRPSSI